MLLWPFAAGVLSEREGVWALDSYCCCCWGGGGCIVGWCWTTGSGRGARAVWVCLGPLPVITAAIKRLPGKEQNLPRSLRDLLAAIKMNRGRRVLCLRLRLSRVPWAVWVGASWDGAPAFGPRNSGHGADAVRARCDDTLCGTSCGAVAPVVQRYRQWGRRPVVA